MTDYQSIWIKWIAFLSMDTSFRRNVFDSLHTEVAKGFDVIARIGTEELEALLPEKGLFEEVRHDLETLLTFNAWSGYSLFLISEGIDPERSRLKASKKTDALGNKWIEGYEKDQNASSFKKLDPILTIFIEKQTKLRMESLFLTHPALQKIAYSQIQHIETFANWASQQGFVFGVIESNLNTEEVYTENVPKT
ncbi:MAG: hypothetical protein HY430_02675 [Candidatus Levybacteria bacterium]|nr:hypothetical protein [Candidatus Levybacteria bacterium]